MKKVIFSTQDATTIRKSLLKDLIKYQIDEGTFYEKGKQLYLFPTSVVDSEGNLIYVQGNTTRWLKGAVDKSFFIKKGKELPYVPVVQHSIGLAVLQYAGGKLSAKDCDEAIIRNVKEVLSRYYKQPTDKLVYARN